MTMRETNYYYYYWRLSEDNDSIRHYYWDNVMCVSNEYETKWLMYYWKCVC